MEMLVEGRKGVGLTLRGSLGQRDIKRERQLHEAGEEGSSLESESDKVSRAEVWKTSPLFMKGFAIAPWLSDGGCL